MKDLPVCLYELEHFQADRRAKGKKVRKLEGDSAFGRFI